LSTLANSRLCVIHCRLLVSHDCTGELPTRSMVVIVSTNAAV